MLTFEQAVGSRRAAPAEGAAPARPRVQRKCTACASGDGEGEKLQAKLSVSQPGDPLEREADATADQVMRMADPAAPAHHSPLIQDDEKDPPLMLKRSGAQAPAAASPAVTPRFSRDGGRPLDAGARRFLEPRLGLDFSAVRVHTDDGAARSAHDLSALGFTVGRDIYFGRGRYQPATDDGRRLLAHELTHVAQQSTRPIAPAIMRQDCPGGSCHDRVYNNQPRFDLLKPRQDSSDALSRYLRVLPPRTYADPSECCAADQCDKPDPTPAPKGGYKLTLAVDRESPNMREALKEGGVGHAWVKLTDPAGRRYSYGMWPQNTLGRNIFKTVPGCIHHADVSHEPPESTEYLEISYALSQLTFSLAMARAQAHCRARPSYNLLDYNCTNFATEITRAAGVTPPESLMRPKFLNIETPNALFSGMQDDKRKRGEDPDPIVSPIKPPPHGAAAGMP